MIRFTALDEKPLPRSAPPAKQDPAIVTTTAAPLELSSEPPPVKSSKRSPNAPSKRKPKPVSEEAPMLKLDV
jgi:hypothetical protein